MSNTKNIGKYTWVYSKLKWRVSKTGLYYAYLYTKRSGWVTITRKSIPRISDLVNI